MSDTDLEERLCYVLDQHYRNLLDAISFHQQFIDHQSPQLLTPSDLDNFLSSYKMLHHAVILYSLYNDLFEHEGMRKREEELRKYADKADAIWNIVFKRLALEE